MAAKSLLEKIPSDRSDTISTSPMDFTNNAQRSEAYANKTCGKETSDHWKVVTSLALKKLHADSSFFASSPSRALPCFDAKGERTRRSMYGELLLSPFAGSLVILHSSIFSFLTEIHLGNLLGVGEFGAVFEVTRITDDSRMQLRELMLCSMASLHVENSLGLLRLDGEDQTDGGEMSSALDEVEEKRGTIRERCWKQGKARYAVKQLRGGMQKRNLLAASVDLAAEKDFLASIQHPNIIRLRGTVGTPGHPRYMLLMDRLYVSMNQKLQE